MVRHHSNTLMQLTKYFLVVMVTEHRIFNVRVQFHWDFLKISEFLEKGGGCSLGDGIEETPGAQSLLVLKAGYLGFNKSYLTFKLFQGCSYDRLVFDGVKTASAVSDLASNLKKLYSLSQNLELQRMKTLAVFCAPVRPLLRDFSNSSVAWAGNVAAYTIEFDSAVFAFLATTVKHLWEVLCQVICDHYVARV